MVIELYHSKVLEVLPLTSKQIHDSELDEIMIETIKLSSIISVLYFKFPKKFQVIIKLGVLRSISMMLPRQGKVYNINTVFSSTNQDQPKPNRA